MPDADSTSYLTISDFSPGIQSTDTPLFEGTNPAPVGSASANDPGAPGTYDCYSLPEGGLGPLPFRFSPLTNGPGVRPDAGNNLSANNRYPIGGLHASKFYSGENSTNNTLTFASVFATLCYAFNAGAGNVTRRVRPYRYDTSIGTLTELQNPAGATPALESGNWPVPTMVAFNAYTPMTDYRTNGNTNPTIPGPPYLYIGVCDPCVAWGANGVSRFPNITVAAGVNDRLESMFARKQTLFLVSHQGRLFINCQETAFTFGPREVIHNDDSYWTVPNQNGLDNGGQTSSFSQAVVGAYGAIDSSNANELVIIRSTSQGGMIVTSDLNSPIVADYKTMQGTNGCIVEGVWTPMGYVYGARDDGVYVYSGGGRTQLISPNLEFGFWQPLTDFNEVGNQGQGFITNTAGLILSIIPVPHLGKFAYHAGFIFCPNNWVYDINQNNWWRFSGAHTDGTELDFKFFDTSPSGQIFAARKDWDIGSTLIAQARILTNTSSLSNSIPDGYRWTSNFIPIAQESEVNEVREVVCNYTATVGDQITIKFWSDGMVGSPWSEDFTTTAAGYFRSTVNPGIRGSKLIMQIQTLVANPNANEAPIINRVDIGLAKVSMIPNTTQ